jgi:hypothetical protein
LKFGFKPVCVVDSTNGAGIDLSTLGRAAAAVIAGLPLAFACETATLPARSLISARIDTFDSGASVGHQVRVPLAVPRSPPDLGRSIATGRHCPPAV